jgi:DNA-binding NarL/FixJ family response regulator
MFLAVRTSVARWMMIEAAPLDGDADGRIAVTLRDAAPAETFDVLCRAYALTKRERAVAAALVGGLDTRSVTERLSISRHTVQDHLKSVFEKSASTAAASSSRRSTPRVAPPRYS